MTKTPINLRLSQKSLVILEDIKENSKKTKTQVIEDALELYYTKYKKSNNKLLKYVGLWEDLDIEKIMKDIKASKVDKDTNPIDEIFT